jgi:hypothetical protein
MEGTASATITPARTMTTNNSSSVKPEDPAKYPDALSDHLKPEGDEVARGHMRAHETICFIALHRVFLFNFPVIDVLIKSLTTGLTIGAKGR